MLVQVTLMLAAAALATAQYEGIPPPPPVWPVGTDLMKGNVDEPRAHVYGIPDIPKGICHTTIPRSKFDCDSWNKLVALRVQARAQSRIPPKVTISEHFDQVTIDGCGPIHLLVEHACQLLVSRSME